MGQYLSADEVRQQYVAALGKELGEIYHELSNELAWLYFKWDQYRALFGESPERIDLLNGAAPLFFRLLQDALWEDTLLHLARLTDSVRSCGKTNLTFRGLPPLVVDPVVQDKTAQLVLAALAATEFARDWRNRHIAHRDLRLALNEPTEELTPASRKLVNEGLAALAAVLNYLHMQYFHATVQFGLTSEHGDALSLLYVLRDGLEAANQRRQRLREGKPISADIQPRPPL